MNPLKYFLLVGAIFCIQVTGEEKSYDKLLAEDLMFEHGFTVYSDYPPGKHVIIYEPEMDKYFGKSDCIDLGYNIVIQRICPCCVKGHYGLPIPTVKPKKKKYRRKKDPSCKSLG